MDADAPPLTVAEEILKDLAPELARHVHSFLHGGSAGTMVLEPDFAAPQIKMRNLLDALHEATSRRRPQYTVAVLSVAVRLQSVILYETLKRLYEGREVATY